MKNSSRIDSYILSFSDIKFLNSIYNLETVIRKYSRKILIEYDINEIKISSKKLAVECLDILKIIKNENNVLKRLNLKTKFSGLFDCKLLFDAKIELLENENQAIIITNPNLDFDFSYVEFYEYIKNFEIKSLDDIEVIEVAFEKICEDNLKNPLTSRI